MSVKLNYQTYGEGKPLLILHGLFGSNRNWSAISRKLSNSYQVISIDMRNHGDSAHADSMTYLEMAEDIINLVATLGHTSIYILGHSMGGKTAMALSLLKPSLLERLIVVDISPTKYQTNHDELISAMLSIPVNKLENRTQADNILSQHITEPTLRQFLLQSLIREDTGFNWRINLHAIQQNYANLRDFPEELAGKTFDKPVLFIAGSLSDYIKKEHDNDIAGFFPNATRVIIENANHWVHADSPEKVIKEVSAFLN